MSEEEKQELQKLIHLLYNNQISQYGKRKLENYINKILSLYKNLKEVNQEHQEINGVLQAKITKLEEENSMLKGMFKKSIKE